MTIIHWLFGGGSGAPVGYLIISSIICFVGVTYTTAIDGWHDIDNTALIIISSLFWPLIIAMSVFVVPPILLGKIIKWWMDRRRNLIRRKREREELL